jgi:hypothetical protein
MISLTNKEIMGPHKKGIMGVELFYGYDLMLLYLSRDNQMMYVALFALLDAT